MILFFYLKWDSIQFNSVLSFAFLKCLRPEAPAEATSELPWTWGESPWVIVSLWISHNWTGMEIVKKNLNTFEQPNPYMSVILNSSPPPILKKKNFHRLATLSIQPATLSRDKPSTDSNLTTICVIAIFLFTYESPRAWDQCVAKKNGL